MADIMDAMFKPERNQMPSSDKPFIKLEQRHYHALQEKHARMCYDFDQLQRAFVVLEKKNDVEERHYMDEIERLREEKQNAVDDFHSYTLQTEERIEEYRKDLDKQNHTTIDSLSLQLDKFKVENEDLSEERDKLQREVIERNSEFRQLKRDCERRQMLLRDQYEEQINKLTDNLLEEHRRDVNVDNEKSELYIVRERYGALNERYHSLYEESERRQLESDGKIQSLETEVLERSMRATRTAIRLEQLSMKVEQYRNKAEFDENELKRLQSEVKGLQRAKLDGDKESVARESSLTDQLLDQSLLIDRKLNEIERNVAEKDRLIEGLKGKLTEAEMQLNCYNDSMKDTLKSKEELAVELSFAKNELQSGEDATRLSLDKLRWERDRALQNLADARKSKPSCSTKMADDVNKLEEVIRNKDCEMRKMKEHYRGLLKRMKKSLVKTQKRLALLNGLTDVSESNGNDEIFQKYLKFRLGQT